MKTQSFVIRLAAILALAAAVSCSRKQNGNAVRDADDAVPPKVFEVNGVIRELKSDGRTAVIQHDAVGDYMPAMTMPFEVRDTNDLKALKVGDPISFRLNVTSNDAWIDKIARSDHAVALPAPAVNVLPDLDPLNVGDTLPEYHFTNQLGQPVSTSQFRGQAVAITFFFTRCPLPTFCPLMSRNFREVQEALLSRPGGPANWHLLSISFDPETDTPALLKNYAAIYAPDPKHWDFLTGDPAVVEKISDQVGEHYWKDGGSITHNLRTVVLDTHGRIQKIITGNQWESDELVKAIVTAAAAEK